MAEKKCKESYVVDNQSLFMMKPTTFLGQLWMILNSSMTLGGGRESGQANMIMEQEMITDSKHA